MAADQERFIARRLCVRQHIRHDSLRNTYSRHAIPSQFLHGCILTKTRDARRYMGQRGQGYIKVQRLHSNI
jgi:hypothetical protein